MAEPTGITQGPVTSIVSAEPATAPGVDANGAPTHQPYVPDQANLPEFTWPAVLVGAVLGIIFGASSLYLVLKVGLTVSASIPVAVLSITLFRLFSRYLPIRRATILENNIVQTTGSAGESIAFGVGVTMPALLLLGFEMDVVRVMTVAVLGGLLGILMMIPLRRAFIVKQHGTLKYPEGTACADVLIVGEKGGATAKTVFVGFGIAFVFAFLMRAMKLWKDTLSVKLYTASGQGLKKGVLGSELGPELLGVGYIIGPRIASIMVAGGVLAYLVLVPAFAFVGEGLDKPLPPAPANGKLIRNMSVGELRSNYILYIGAGAVATGGIVSMFQALPVIFGSVLAGLRDLRGKRGDGGNGSRETPRTERDLPMSVVVFGSLGLVIAIALAPKLGLGFTPLGLVASALIVLLGFLFVTVSSRLTGEIGSSSNPISGMTVAALLLTCLVFLLLGETGKAATLTALTVAAVVCIASSNGGTTSQDLKTGYLVGGTPKWQQLAILVGALTSALVIGLTLLALNSAGTVYTRKAEFLPSPLTAEQLATLKSALAKGDTTRERAGGQYSADPVEYIVMHVGEAESEDLKIPQGKYLVDDNGVFHYMVDPAINGRLKKWDEGRDVSSNKFEAPKAQLMSKIINGILNQKLPWGLVLLGVLIAVTLELSGVPSLPFAVGVYLPLESSVPIFVGGMVRLFVNKLTKKPTVPGQPPPSDTDDEMSSGSLLATGYIAGGTIGGVVVSFLAMSDTITNALGGWQYREYKVPSAMSVEDAYTQLAIREKWGLGPGDPKTIETIKEMNSLKESKERSNYRAQKGLGDAYDDIEDLNKETILQHVPIPAGVKLILPDETKHNVEKETTLGEVARSVLMDAGKAGTLFEDNQHLEYPPLLAASTAGVLGSPLGQGPLFAAAALVPGRTDLQLEAPEALPAGAELKVPQTDLPAVIASALMIVLLAVVGLGLILKTPPPGAPANGSPTA
jgi:putative OPT family oligopeptide transporter